MLILSALGNHFAESERRPKLSPYGTANSTFFAAVDLNRSQRGKSLIWIDLLSESGINSDKGAKLSESDVAHAGRIRTDQNQPQAGYRQRCRLSGSIGFRRIVP